MPELIQQLLEHSRIKGSKSTAVTPHGWITVALLASMVGAMQIGASLSVIITLLVLVSLSVLSFGAACWFFTLTNPDALRSEKYVLSKIALEQSAKGDDLTGIIEGTTVTQKLLPPDGTEDD